MGASQSYLIVHGYLRVNRSTPLFIDSQWSIQALIFGIATYYGDAYTASIEGRTLMPVKRNGELSIRRKERSIHRREIQVFGEMVVSEVELLERRHAFEDQCPTQIRVSDDPCEQVAESVI